MPQNISMALAANCLAAVIFLASVHCPLFPLHHCHWYHCFIKTTNAHAAQLHAEANLLRLGVSVELSVNTPQFKKSKDRGVELSVSKRR